MAGNVVLEDAGHWLPVNRAAAELGISERQIRRDIVAGEYRTRLVAGATGRPRLEVLLPPGETASPSPDAAAPGGPQPDPVRPDTSPAPALVALERLLAAEAAGMWEERARELRWEVSRSARPPLAGPGRAPAWWREAAGSGSGTGAQAAGAAPPAVPPVPRSLAPRGVPLLSRLRTRLAAALRWPRAAR